MSEFPHHRFVYNPEAGQLRITAACHGNDGVINRDGAEMLERWSAQGAATDHLSHRAARFLTACVRRGWVDEHGEVCGTFTRTPPGPHLQRLQIELSLRCNLSCNYCYSESGPSRNDELSLPSILKIISDGARLGVTWLDLTGGEILIHPHWEDIVVHARREGLVVTLHTNGVLLTERNVAKIVSYGVRRVQVSVDSHLQKVNDAIRGPQGSLDRMLRGVKRAKAAGIPMRLSLMVHQRNRDHLAAALRFFSDELRIPIVLDRIMRFGGEIHEPIGITTAEFYELIAPIVSRQVPVGRVCENIADNGQGGRVEPECGVAHSFVYVTASGEYAICPTMTSRDDARFSGPNCMETTLEDAWLRSAYFNEIRGTNCRNTHVCPTARACGGGCRSNAYLETGQLDAPDVLMCNLNKNPGPVFVDFLSRYEAGNFRPVEIGTR